MEKNKRTLLSILIIAILMIGVVGMTYAFFNFTRTGASNNIKVGRIAFNSRQNGVINLTNVFPIDKNNANSDTDNVGSVTINITGDTTYSDGIEYLVTAVNINNSIGTGNNQKQVPISVSVSYEENENKTIGESDKDYFDNRGGNTSLYKVLAGNQIAEGNKIVVGYIAPGQTGIDGNINIKAYIDKDNIAISDTYPSGTHSETIGEDTYEVNNNLTESELNLCVASMAYLNPNSQITYGINENATSEDIDNCVTYFSGMNVPLQEGESYENFCRGTGTLSGLTLDQVIGFGGLNDALLDMNIIKIISEPNMEPIEYFCQGTGSLNGKTFQQMLDDGNISLYNIDYLKENNIITQTGYAITKKWTDGTTNEWVNGRVVLTTSEWNGLQQDGISFQVKVEANEGIWVPEQGNAMNKLPKFITNDYSTRSTITEIYFEDFSENELNSRYNQATLKEDITYDNEGRVLSWIEPDTTDNTKNILYIASDGDLFLTTGNNLINDFNNLKKIEFNNFNTSRVTEMKSMFYRINKLEELDLTSFDTSNVTSMSNFIYRVEDLVRVDLTGLDMRKVQDMSCMFMNDFDLEEIILDGVRTRDIVNMHNMFDGSNKIEYIDLEGLGGDNLEYIGSNLFTPGSTNIKRINMKNFNFGKVANLDNLFKDYNKLEVIDLSGIKINNVTSFNNMFANCYKLTSFNFNGVDTSNVENWSSMFYECRALSSIDLSNLSTSSVTNMSYMFYNCNNLEAVNLSGLGGSQLSNVSMIFANTQNLKTVNMSGFNFGSVAYLGMLLDRKQHLESIDLSNAITTNITSMTNAFSNNPALISVDLSNIDTSNVDSVYQMFYNCPLLTTVYVGNDWDVSHVSSSYQMFEGSTSLVGGNGTTYDSTKTNGVMAVIDNNEHEGYLTLKTS